MAKRKRNVDEGTGSNVSLTMTVSLFLILLTFFILLNSIAVVDESKKLLALGSLLGAFSGLHRGLSPLTTGESILVAAAPMTTERLDLKRLLSFMDKRVVGQITLGSGEKGVIISINESVLFGRDISRLKKSSHPLLNELSELMRKGDYPIEISGHTDNTPPEEKGYASNWEITSLTALRVLRYFIEKGGVMSERISAYGCGSNQPVATNDTRQSRVQNRRVEIALHFKAPEYLRRIYRKEPSGIFTYKKFDFRIFGQ
ncbi:MAG: OmpA family protein [Deltaproteobacteria bacterium]|nr:OmpA family protein [Deltaproteobacteria bacterium]